MAPTFPRFAPTPFGDTASAPMLPHFDADVARRLGDIAVNLASRRRDGDRRDRLRTRSR